MADKAFARPGRFTWMDLSTPDLGRARPFYAAVLPCWRLEDLEANRESTYKRIKVGTEYIGGFLARPGIPTPSHWLCYVESDDVDRACLRARRRDGVVVFGPVERPGVGRYAVVRDPHGAVFAPFQSRDPPFERPGGAVEGEFCWFQLQSPHPPTSLAFYREVCEWDTSDEEGPFGRYHLVRRGDRPVAAILQRTPDRVGPAAWLPFVLVDDVDLATERARRAGGAVLRPPTDIPRLGRFAVLADPLGARIALFR